MKIHLVLSDFISWQYLLLILFGVIFFLWLIWGGRDDLEYIGLKPLLARQDSDSESEEGKEEGKEEKEEEDSKGKRINFTPKIPGALSDEFSVAMSEDIDEILQNVEEDMAADIINIESKDSYHGNAAPPNMDGYVHTPKETVNIPLSPNTLSLGSNKPYNNCKLSKGETLCKKAIEDIYKKPFYCVRPDFLKNPETGRNLELDLYNDELKIAVEYNGAQHYLFPNRLHSDYEEFLGQIRRDKLKVDLCDENGIYLITVPYNVPLNYEDIKKYIEFYLPENVARRAGIL